MDVNEIKMMIDNSINNNTIYPFGLINLKTQRRQHLELIEYMVIKLIITKM